MEKNKDYLDKLSCIYSRIQIINSYQKQIESLSKYESRLNDYLDKLLILSNIEKDIFDNSNS